MRLAVRLLGNEADAEDAVQESLIDALLGLATYDRKLGTFKAWVSGLVKNRCKRIRRERDAVSTVALDEAIEIAGGDPLDAIIAEETANETRAAIANLPKAQREAFEMHADGKSAKEIACLTGGTVKSIERKIERARAKLRGDLSPFCA